jgi:hypothetical protein
MDNAAATRTRGGRTRQPTIGLASVPPQVNLDNLFTVGGVVARWPELGTEASWRWRIFNEQRNGLADYGVVVRLPGTRQILIDVARFKDLLAASRSAS